MFTPDGRNLLKKCNPLLNIVDGRLELAHAFYARNTS
jgi:hypothetical protein